MAAGEQLRLGFLGGGTAIELGHPPSALDAVLATDRLTRVLEYAPADMVLVAEAGTTLAAVQAQARAHGQRLALDPPWPERATLGGLIATGGFGPLRARYGGIRDLIIGVTLVRADGQVARGGGKVVKNVAGFDLPKVACGSLGTLGLIAAAAFRLHPLPEVATTVLAPGLSPDAVVALLAAARHAQLEPAAAVAIASPGADTAGSAGGRFDLGLVFEGFARGVSHQVAQLVELAGKAGGSAEPLSDAAAGEFWRRHDAVRTAVPLRIRIASLPTRFPAVAALVAGIGSLAWYPTLGVGFVGTASGALPTGASPGDAAAAVAAARSQLIGDGGSLVIETAPAALRAAVDPWGPVPQSFAIMQQLKQRFDPDRRLNPGRFVGGL